MQKLNNQKNIHKITTLFGAFLGIYFLFSSGVIYSILNDPPYNPWIDNRMPGPFWGESGFTSAPWINSHFDYKHKLYTDVDNYPIFRLFALPEKGYCQHFKAHNENIRPPYYIYLAGYQNIFKERVRIAPYGPGSTQSISLTDFIWYKNILHMNKLYNNNLAIVYHYGG